MASDVNALGADILMRPNSITTTTAIRGKDASQMGMDDFFNLLVAQMTNQDMMNPTADTEYIAQMAQFTTLQGINTIQEYQLSSYAASYAGKNVTIAVENEMTGALETVTGAVESVTFYSGKPKVIVNGTAYDLHTVMEINGGNGSLASLSAVSGYVGKTVKVGYKDEDANPVIVTGVVESVTLNDYKPCIVIDGKTYYASDIISVEN